MPALIVSNINKSFFIQRAPKRILADVSFRVPEGTVACLLGLNGSGKTTLLKCISTLLTPEEGAIFFDDINVHENQREAKRLLGFTSTDDHSFYGRLTVKMNLWFYGQMHGLTKSLWQTRMDKITDDLKLSDILDRSFRELSNGQKQKTLLARSLLHNPSMLLMDEPHQNLDPDFSSVLRTLITEVWSKRERKTILVSTHHLDEAQKISDNWVIISEGRIRFSGSLSKELAKKPGTSVEEFFKTHTAYPDAV